MQIKGMMVKKELNILGRIGLGITEPVLDKKTGQPVKLPSGDEKTRPRATEFFVVPQEVINLLGDSMPTQIPIHFEMNKLADSCPTAMMLFRSNGDLICMGNGQRVTFRRHVYQDHSVVTVIYDQVAKWDLIEELGLLEPGQWDSQEDGYGTIERVGTNAVRCLYMDCPRYKRLLCKPTGKLRFCIEGIKRQGYYQMTFHLKPMKGLLTQIEDGRQWIRNRIGRGMIVHPAQWLLTLEGPTEQWMNVRKRQNGQIVVEKQLIKNIYTPKLELDPQFMEDLDAGRVEFPRMDTLTEDDIWGAREEGLDETLLAAEPYVETSSDEEQEIPF